MTLEAAFASEKPSRNPNTVDQINRLETQGHWRTKSDADLSLLFAFDNREYDFVRNYDLAELQRIPLEMRGLRCYTVRGIPCGKTGGKEFHRIRTEVLFGLEGTVGLELEDVFGNIKYLELDSKHGVQIPPFILHTYTAKTDKAGLLVISNTLFNPNYPLTHDTFSLEAFRRLQEDYKEPPSP